jgi:hypothetical protein
MLTEVVPEEQRPAGRRVLCGFETHQPFAYARGDDYFRCADHSMWAHRVGGNVAAWVESERAPGIHGQAVERNGLVTPRGRGVSSR